MCSPIIGTVWAATFWLVAQVATAWAWKDSQVLFGGEANERNIPQWKDTKHLRIYIVDSIPAAYTSRHSSRAGPSVGPQAPTPYSNLVNSDGSSTDEPHPFAGSKDIFFHQWMVDQLRASPLRVYEEEQADFFVIPTFLPADDTILQACLQSSDTYYASMLSRFRQACHGQHTHSLTLLRPMHANIVLWDQRARAGHQNASHAVQNRSV